MNSENCPDWICNEFGIPNNIFCIIAFLILSIPYVVIVYQLFQKKIKNSAERKRCYFYLLMPIGLYLYFMALFFIFIQINGEIFSFLGAVSYGTIMWMIILIPFLIIGLIILPFTNIGKEK